MKKIVPATALVLSSLTTATYAQGIATRLNLPKWTEDISINVAFVNDTMDFEGSSLQNIDAQGTVIEIANRYSLGENLWTQSALRGKVTNSEDELTDIDNKSIGLMQRISKSFPVNSMFLTTSLGAGVNYGGVEVGFLGDPNDQNYISYTGEAKIKLETGKGLAPYLGYNYEIADLENTTNELTIHSLTAGLSLVF